MNLKYRQICFSVNYLLLLLLAVITLTFCTHETEKDVETEKEQQRLTMLMDSIDNNDVYRSPEKVLIRLPKAISLANALNDSIALCRLMLIKSGCFNELGNADSNFVAAKNALRISEIINNDTLLAKAYNSMGNFYANIRDYVKATDSYTKALKLMEKSGNASGIALVKNNLGIIYRKIGEIGKSIKCYTEALSVFDSVHDEFKVALICLNLNSAYSSIKDSINTRKYYKKSFSLLEKYGDTLQMAKLLMNQSSFYINIGKLDSAIITLMSVIDYSKAMNNNQNYCIALYNLGSLYYTRVNDLDKARFFIGKCIDINLEVSDPEIKMESCHVLSEIENSAGNYKKSNDFFRKYVALRDSIKGGNIKKEIMAIKMQNDFEKKELEVRLLKQKFELQGKQNTILIITLVSFLLIIIVTIFIVRIAYNNLKKSNTIKKLEKQWMEEQMQKEQKISEMEKLRHDIELEAKNKELVSYSLKLVTKNDLIGEIRKLSNKYYDNEVLNREYFNDLTKIIEKNLNIDKEWNQFKTLFEKVHHGFFDRLKQKHPVLTEHELRFCAYVKINLRPKEIARILSVSPNTIKSFRYRLKKRLNLPPDVSIDDFVRNI